MYELVVVAINERGVSHPVTMTGFTLNSPAIRGQHHQGPSEAEVRDIGDNNGDGKTGRLLTGLTRRFGMSFSNNLKVFNRYLIISEYFHNILTKLGVK